MLQLDSRQRRLADERSASHGCEGRDRASTPSATACSGGLSGTARACRCRSDGGVELLDHQWSLHVRLASAVSFVMRIMHKGISHLMGSRRSSRSLGAVRQRVVDAISSESASKIGLLDHE